MMMAAQSYTSPGRFEKALALADLLDAAGIGSSDAATMHPGEWRLVMEAFRASRVPSQQTRELVVLFLRRREAARLQLKF